MLEFLIELVIDLILDGSVEISEDEKAPKWARYLAISILGLVFGAVSVGMIILGIYLGKENIYIGLLFILIGFILLISGIVKFEKIYIKRKNLINDD